MDQHLLTAQTPALVLDRSRMLRNIAKMARTAQRLGVSLRPHVKTPKSPDVVRALAEAGARCFTVSTLREAEMLADMGIEDIFYAVPLAAEKVARIAGLLRRGARVSVMVDSPLALARCIAACKSQDVHLDVWLEIDVDHYRTGLEIAPPQFAAITELLLAAPARVTLRGLASYAGASYGSTDTVAMGELARRHCAELLAARATIEALGVPCGEISLGSGPAVTFAENLDGVTEVRCGIYVFQDLFQVGIGACGAGDVAVSVLTSVIGVQPHLNRLIIDAGGLALSKDRSTQGRPFDCGYGLVCDVETAEPIADLFISAVSQELGIVTAREGKPFPATDFAIGQRLRVLPNHADMTAAAYDEYLVVEGTDGCISATWPRVNGW